LANADYEICDALDTQSNATLYDYCRQVPMQSGFQFVDAYYPNNIDPDSQSFGHNPEWMVAQAQTFINKSVNGEEPKPFFLYFSHTLTHEPITFPESLFRFSMRDTPKGQLFGADIPSDIGMWSRTHLWEQVSESLQNGERLNTVAAAMWLDNSIGAMLSYLQRMGLFDDTMIILLTDHGMLAKFTLFEQGTRIMQVIRYPKLFEAHSVLPNDFVTSTVDLAQIIFELSETQIDEKYVTDSVNWLQSAMDVLSASPTPNATVDADIGSYRFSDYYNSHAIVSVNWKYIWRANQLFVENAEQYPHCADYEQLYDLRVDGAETNNVANDDSLAHIVRKMRQIMIDYIETIACPQMPCKVPQLTMQKKSKSASWMKYLLM